VELSKYIKDILVHNDNVIVSGFGAFEKTLISAKIDPVTSEMHPPQNTVIFRPELTIDSGVLSKYVSEKELVPLDNAVELIQMQVTQWSNTLESDKKLTLEGLGILTKDETGNLQFESTVQPSDFPESYGLPIIPIQEKTGNTAPPIKNIEQDKPIDKKAEAKNIAQKKIPIKKKPVSSTMKSESDGTTKSHKKLVVGLVLAVLVVAIVVGGVIKFDLVKQKFNSSTQYISSLFKSNPKGNVPNIDSGAKDSTAVEDSINEGIVAVVENYTIINDKDNSKIQPKMDEFADIKKVYIIAGSFKSKNNASRQKKLLSKKGFTPEILPLNNGLYRISVASFSDMKSAAGDFERIKSIDESLNLWILVNK